MVKSMFANASNSTYATVRHRIKRATGQTEVKQEKSAIRRKLESLLPGQKYVLNSAHGESLRRNAATGLNGTIKRFEFKKLPNNKWLVTRTV